MLIHGFLSVLVTTGVWIIAYRLLVKRTFDAFSILLMFFAFIILGRGYMLALGLDTPSPDYLFGHYEYLVIISQIYAALWLASLTAAARLLGAASLVFRPLFPSAPLEPRFRATFWLTMGFTLAGATVSGFLLARYGSFQGVIWAVKVSKDLAGWYMLRQFSMIGSFLSILLLFQYHMAKRRGAIRVDGPWIVLIGALLLVNFLNIYIWGTREIIGIALLTLLIGFSLYIRRIHPLVVLGGAGGVVGLLFALRLLRDYLLTGRAHALDQGNILRAVSLALHNVRFDAFMLAIRDWIGTVELRAGQDFLVGFLGIIPRVFWPDKPELVIPGAWFRRLYEPEKINGWPFTVMGEWMVNFGLPGLFLGAALSGVIFRAIQDRYDRFERQPTHFVMTMILALIVFQNGFWTTAPIRYVLWIVPLFVIFWTMRPRHPDYSR